MERPQLEVCCFNAESAIIAANRGADRIELCDGQDLGGVTPPMSWLADIYDNVDRPPPIYVMIRPRGGDDFCYSANDFALMQRDIDRFKRETAASGFVFGILKGDKTVDIDRTKQLVQLAGVNMPCTFHRAFDYTLDPIRALEDVISTGCENILTSGGASTLDEGTVTLPSLINRAAGRISIMPCGGIRSANIAGIHNVVGAHWYHSSGLRPGENCPDANEVLEMILQLTRYR